MNRARPYLSLLTIMEISNLKLKDPRPSEGKRKDAALLIQSVGTESR